MLLRDASSVVKFCRTPTTFVVRPHNTCLVVELGRSQDEAMQSLAYISACKPPGSHICHIQGLP